MPSTNEYSYLYSLVMELCKLPNETEWVEFKHNNSDPHKIGEYISSLSNSAALIGKANAYLIWGITAENHEIVGTKFWPHRSKVGNEEIENWLLRLLEPKIKFRFLEVSINGCRIVLLEIPRASQHPVSFNGIEYIRVGSCQKKLKTLPEYERDLWRIFDDVPFEDHIAATEKRIEDVMGMLNFASYFELLNLPIPSTESTILNKLEDDSLIVKSNAGLWNITNLGAILFANNLADFRALRRKTPRIVHYKGNGRETTIKEYGLPGGLATSFKELISIIIGLLPSNEIIERAIRSTVPLYPEIAVRELVANAIIHQDFFISGAGPMIEIFDNRMEITNPGTPLIETERFLDNPPRSRNDVLASHMRRMGICEERGSGIDKVVFQTEIYQLPPPLFEAVSNNTRAVIFAPKKLRRMDIDERVRACYLHSCLRYVNKDFMTNATLRDRFGIDKKNSAMASRFIREAIDANMIKPYNPDASKKYMKYIPFWA